MKADCKHPQCIGPPDGFNHYRCLWCGAVREYDALSGKYARWKEDPKFLEEVERFREIKRKLDDAITRNLS